MEHYTKKGLYNSYDKNHKERDTLDYYATPPGETLNILNKLNLNLDNSIILEPACGGGHMVKDIQQYLQDKKYKAKIIATDIHEHEQFCDFNKRIGLEYDFISDNYPVEEKIDYIIMNPPFSTIEPFTIRALEIANKGVLMIARLQFLEGKGRYENILADNPPSEVYIYVDRINCWKDGKLPQSSSAQAYAWFFWDKTKSNISTNIKWIRRI